MINWDDVNTVEELYPEFRKYVRKHRGFLCCPSAAEIKLWYDFRKYFGSGGKKRV